MIAVNRNNYLQSIIQIPQELQNMSKWCGFYNDNTGNLDKKPISILTKKGGIKTNDNDNLVSYKRALEVLNEGKIAALGYGLSSDDSIICIDIDCHKPELQPQYKELKTELLSKFKSYAETSISGTGTHLLIKGKIPEGYKNKDSYGLLEVFDSRFIVATGDIIDGRTSSIIEEQDALEWLCEKYLQKNNLRELSVVPQGKSTKTDEEIIGKVCSTYKGSLLFNGDFHKVTRNKIPCYSSKSEADLALCNTILYYNNNDIGQCKRIFSLSAMKNGLEKKSSGYLNSQILYASTTLQSIYDWTNCNIQQDSESILHTTTDEEALINSVKEFGYNVTNNTKLNEFATKYLLTYGYNKDCDIIDTNLLDYDSAGNGERFYLINNASLLYNPNSNEWARWDNRKWSRCYDSDLLGEAQKVFDNIKHEAFDLLAQSLLELDEDKKLCMEKKSEELFRYASTSKNKRNCMEMIEFSKSHFDPTEYTKLENPRNAINLSNGIFDFDHTCFIPHTKEYYQTMISSATYNPTDTCATWLKTLERIVPDKDVKHYLHKAVGYTLSSKYSEKALFILHGGGNNGKTTFINIILKLMGEYSVIVSPQTIMENASNKNNGPRPDLLRLRDKRFAAVSESNENDKLSEGIIKSLTGAGYISCRTLHKEPIEFRAIGKYWFDTNHRPTVKGTDSAIWSRLKVIPFEVQIPKAEIDTSLGEKLELELSGILNWGIEGYQMYCKEGLEEPEQIKLVMNEYAEDMSACDQWWRECIDIKTDSIDMQKTSVNSKELYQSYRNWCSYNGEFSWSQRKFTTEINKKDACKITKTVNGIVRYKLVKLNELGQLCYRKDEFYGTDFGKQYSDCINTAFRKQAKEESALKAINNNNNPITRRPTPSSEKLLGFGQ